MTLSEIKQKIDEYFATHTEQEVYDALVRNGAIAEESPESETLEEGWVVRDECGDLYFYQEEPHRSTNVFQTLVGAPEGVWVGHKLLSWGDRYRYKELPKDFFPSVTWESEPLKARITITPIEDE